MYRMRVMVFIFLFIPLLSTADRVILKNGRTIRGRIIEGTENRVSLLTSAGNFSLLKEDIAKIEEESPEENFLLEVELSLVKKDAVSALSAYKKALSLGLSTNYQVLQMEEDLRNVQINSLRAKVDYWKARAMMLKATGMFLQEEKITNDDISKIGRG